MRYGYFDNEHREYVIERPDVPVSWTNYLGIKDLCTVISHNAGGYSFYQNAEHKRITRFRANGVPLDRPGHYVYLRDDDTGDYWSVSWQPVGKDLQKAKYECRHGLSYSKFSCDYSGIQAEQTLFIPPEDDVELWDVKLRNTGSAPRRLSVFGYAEFSFHHIEIDNQNLQMSLYASGSNYHDGIIEYDFYYEPTTFHYFAASFEPDGFDSMRDAFLGNYRTETNPIAVEKGLCQGSVELGGNHCGALQKHVTIEPGSEVRLVFMLGVGPRAQGPGPRVLRICARPGRHPSAGERGAQGPAGAARGLRRLHHAQPIRQPGRRAHGQPAGEGLRPQPLAPSMGGVAGHPPPLLEGEQDQNPAQVAIRSKELLATTHRRRAGGHTALVGGGVVVEG